MNGYNVPTKRPLRICKCERHGLTGVHPMRRNTIADVQSKLDKCVPTNGPLDTPCLIWQFYINTEGYGTMPFCGMHKKAHRLAWTLQHGEIPDGLCVCHKCDNRACCNVDHMFLGTVADNHKDMMVKGRHWVVRGDMHGTRTKPESLQRGESHHRHKLTESDVTEIRNQYANCTGSKRKLASQLAARFSVCMETIGNIARGKTWKHLLDNPIAADAVRKAGG